MKKTTIWISPEGVPMHSPNGWPEVPDTLPNPIKDKESIERYRDALAKAKKEAIRFDDEYAIKRTLLHLVEYTPNAHVDEIWMNAKWPRHGDPKPDSFVDIEGEVTTIWQFKLNGKWHDFSSDAVEVVNRYANEGAETRQVARVKPAEAVSDPGVGQYYKDTHENNGNRCECELFVEKYFGINTRPNEKFVIHGADYGQMVNMLAMFRDEQLAGTDITAQQINHECQKHNDELVKQLAEAKARIKELEDLFEDQHNWE